MVNDIDINDHDEIGYIETSMGTVMGSRNQTLTAELKNDSQSGKRGQIIIRAEAESESSHMVHFKVEAEGIANFSGCMGMCTEVKQCHFVLSREIGANSNHFAPTYTSPLSQKTRSPAWQPQKMRLAKFSNGDPSCRVKLTLMCE